MSDPQPTTADDAPADTWPQQLRELLHGLFDLQFRTILTTRLIPAIYTLGLGLDAVLTLHFTLAGFRESWLSGALWLLLFGPALFVGVAVALRISLEVILSLFRLDQTVERMSAVLHEIGGQTEEIATDLPRIQFWKPRRRGNDRDD